MKQMVLKNRKYIEDYCREYGNLGYYSCFPTIYSHFCCGLSSVWEHDDVLLVQKGHSNKLSTPFRDIEWVYKCTDLVPARGNISSEYIIHLPDKLDGRLCRDIRRALRKYNLTIDSFDPIRFEDFMNRWKVQHMHYFRLSYKRDHYLMDCLPFIKGIAAYDGEKMVAAGLYCPHPNQSDLVVTIFHKHDMDYMGIHALIQHEMNEQCLNEGYKWANDSGAGRAELKYYKDKFLGENGYMYKLGEITHE